MYNNTVSIINQNSDDIARYLTINKELHQNQRWWFKMPPSPEREVLTQKITHLKKELNRLNKRLSGITA